MAALTSTIIAATGAALGAYQFFEGQQQSNDAAAAAARIAAQQRALAETDKMANVQVPQLGYQLAQQAEAQRNISQIQALQGAGAQAVLGGVPQLAQQGQQEDLQLRAAIDQQKYQRDMQVAQQEQAIEARRVDRQNEQLGLQLHGAQLASAQGQANMNAGLSGIMSSLGTAGNLYLQQKSLYPQQDNNQKTATPTNTQYDWTNQSNAQANANLNNDQYKNPYYSLTIPDYLKSPSVTPGYSYNDLSMLNPLSLNK